MKFFLHEDVDGYEITSAYWAYEEKDGVIKGVNPYFYNKCITGHNPDGTVTHGKAGTKWLECDGLNDLKPDFDHNPIKARHYGFLFNTYVMLQIFN